LKFRKAKTNLQISVFLAKMAINNSHPGTWKSWEKGKREGMGAAASGTAHPCQLLKCKKV